MSRCSELRIRDAVQWWCLPGPLKPSLAAVSLALPGQTAPSRHHHCPAHLAAEPPRVRNSARTFLQNPGGESPKERRDRVGPSRTVFGQGWPNAEPTGMYSWRVLDGPTRSRCGLSGETGFLERKASGILPASSACLSRAWPAPTRPPPAERKNPPFRRAFRWGLARGNQLSSPGSSNGMETVAAPPST